MAKSIQITLQDEDYQEAKAMADMRHWEVEQWIEFSLRHVARCVDNSSNYRKRKPSLERFRQTVREARKKNIPSPDEIDQILREQMLRELKSELESDI